MYIVLCVAYSHGATDYVLCTCQCVCQVIMVLLIMYCVHVSVWVRWSWYCWLCTVYMSMCVSGDHGTADYVLCTCQCVCQVIMLLLIMYCVHVNVCVGRSWYCWLCIVYITTCVSGDHCIMDYVWFILQCVCVCVCQAIIVLLAVQCAGHVLPCPMGVWPPQPALCCCV